MLYEVITDLYGRMVRTLVDGRQAAGRYEAVFDAADLASGAYMYRLEAGAFRDNRVMVLVK